MNCDRIRSIDLLKIVLIVSPICVKNRAFSKQSAPSAFAPNIVVSYFIIDGKGHFDGGYGVALRNTLLV